MLFSQLKRNATIMAENGYKADVKVDPLGDRSIYIVDKDGKIKA